MAAWQFPSDTNLQLFLIDIADDLGIEGEDMGEAWVVKVECEDSLEEFVGEIAQDLGGVEVED